MSEYFVQCKLQKEQEITYSWVPKWCARKNTRVELPDVSNGMWKIVDVIISVSIKIFKAV